MSGMIMFFMEIMGLDCGMVSRETGYPEDLVRRFATTDPTSVAERTPDVDHAEFEKFSRDFCLAFGLHRSVLRDPSPEYSDGLRLPVIGNADPMIDGIFGVLHLRLPILGEFGVVVPQGAASDICMPVPGEPISFLDDAMHVHILRLEAFQSFRMEEWKAGCDPNWPKGYRIINPEALLGLLDLAGREERSAPHAAEGCRYDRSDMNSAYISAVRNHFRDEDVACILEACSTIELLLVDGTRKTFRLNDRHSRMMSGLYRMARERRLPPFFILHENDWVEGIPMERIAMISIPWTMLADTGAHVDLTDLQDGMNETVDDLPGVSRPHDNDEDLLIVTDRMVGAQMKKES